MIGVQDAASGVRRAGVTAAVLVLALVQAFLAVHQVEHWEHPEEAASCEVCLPGSGLDHGHAAPSLRPPSTQGARVATMITPAPLARGTFVAFRARGPPPEVAPA